MNKTANVFGFEHEILSKTKKGVFVRRGTTINLVDPKFVKKVDNKTIRLKR